jgi:ABC-type antimicrobial peptide transport system permease subunit
VPVDTSNEYIINETYMRALGFTNPFDALGKTLDKRFTIVGVVSDFHTQSLQTEIKPTAILYRSDGHSFGIKLSTPHQKVSDLDPAIKKIEAAWKRIYPEEKFSYQFLSESVKNFYRTEQRVGTLVQTATGIAILISCLGLFGLSSFTVIQRTKEIGIRKVLGATVNSILVLLSWDFLKLVIIAFIVSVPVAYYLANEWLQKFAYHTDLTAWIFIASGLVSVAVALMTISLRTVDAAKADPVKALRYE